jgi:beta-lactamase class D
MKIFLSLALYFLLIGNLSAKQCFMFGDFNDSEAWKQEGECELQYTPQSTFKIVLSLMGFDSGILQNENNPEWKFDSSFYNGSVNACKSDHNPETWMRDSCVWYSQLLTSKLGMAKFSQYIQILNYGNQNLQGNPGKDDGLTNSWLDSSLKISPIGQAIFLQNMLKRSYNLSGHAYEMTKNIMFVMDLAGGWKLYGKSGTGLINKARNIQHGWFIGWVEKDDKKIIFVNHLVDEDQQEAFAGLRARSDVLIRLWKIINESDQ